MGAIFGVWGNVSEGELTSMARSLAHRGESIHVQRFGDDIGVGAIGAEPALDVVTDGDRVLVCDAKIYNAADLRLPVQQREGDPSGASPAQIISTLHQAEGAEGLARIDGDYAFALIDRRCGELILGRDFFGCRPLYFARLPGGRIAFASEYKALLALPEVRPEVDRDMVQYLQCAKRVPVGKTLLANVSEAMPGMITRMGPNCEPVVTHTHPPLIVDVSVTKLDQAVNLIRYQLNEAVRRRSADLKQIGLALSGGIDSIAVAFLLRRIHPDTEIHTFTAGYGADDPEILTAKKVAAKISSHHHEVITPPSLMQSRLRDLVWHLEDPFARSEALQLLEVGRVARNYVDVLFSAQGSDGLFAGAPKYAVFHLMKMLPMCRGGLRELYDLTQLSLPPRSLVGKIIERLYYNGNVPPVPGVIGARMPERMELPPLGGEFINLNMAKGLQAGICMSLHKFDRMFAASGLEYRSPFYDLALVRAAFTITDKLKIRGHVSKYVLRRALATIVDDEFCQLPKFPQRMRYDVAFAEALDEVAREALSDASVRRRGLFVPDSIRILFRKRRDRPYSAEAAMRLWTAVLTELWAQQFVDRREEPMSAPYDPSIAAERPLVPARDLKPVRAY